MILCLIGTGWAAFALIFPLIFKMPRTFTAAIISAPLAGLVSRICKHFFSTPRPPAVLEPDSFRLLVEVLKDSSMPSGHTITAFTVVAAIFFSQTAQTRKRLVWIWLIAIGAGLSRIAVGIHWTEDVIAGSLIGIATGYLGAVIAKKIPDQRLTIQSIWIRLLSLWAPVCVYGLLRKPLDFAETMFIQQILAGLLTVAFCLFWYQSLFGQRSRLTPPP